jgi:hypothetical protein
MLQLYATAANLAAVEAVALPTMKQAMGLLEQLERHDEEGFNALHRAICDESEEALTGLVELGMDLNLSTTSSCRFASQSPLRLTMNSGAQLSHTAVGHLLKRGIDPNQVDHIGMTPLMGFAARSTDQSQILKLLLDHGARLAAVNASNSTALHVALSGGFFAGHMENVRLLLEAGSDISARDNSGATPSDMAMESQDQAIRELFSKFAP